MPVCPQGLLGFKCSPQSWARLREKRVLSPTAACPELCHSLFSPRLTRGLPSPGGAVGALFLFSVTGPRHLLETSCSPPGRRFPFPAQNLPPASVPLPGACGAAAAAGSHPVRNVPVGMHSIRPDLLFSPLIFLRLTLVFASRWQEALWCCSRAVLGLCGEPSPRELHFPAHALSVQTQAA